MRYGESVPGSEAPDLYPWMLKIRVYLCTDDVSVFDQEKRGNSGRVGDYTTSMG